MRYLIDLRQKQANFSEAISARELARQTAENTELQIKQAQETTRHGKTLMVFTVVTIISVRGTDKKQTDLLVWFVSLSLTLYQLPLSFLAAFFAINVDVFPWNENDNIELNYLLKYMCKQRHLPELSVEQLQ